jgi:hypothetical protein
MISIRYAIWEDDYCAAILETDNTKLPGRIAVASLSVGARLEQLRMDGGGTTSEQHALSDALHGLETLKKERLG